MAKKHYRVRNWKYYNESLVKRGNILLWFTEEVVRQWQFPRRSGKRGRPEKYPGVVIECALSLRALFHLPFRATQGLLESLTKWLGLAVEVPDYTTLNKRQRHFRSILKTSAIKPGEKIHVVVDATGLKVYGEGEWTRRQHGKRQRRTWRKIHLAVNAQSFEIVGAMLTEASCHDGEVLPALLETVKASPGRCIGDGAYDHRKNYQYLHERDAKAIIPPRRDAKISQHGNCKKPPLARDEAIRFIRRHGQKQWKVSQGYHVRSLAETMMYCFKTAFGAQLQNRSLETQAVEVGIKCNILNKFRTFGKPESYLVEQAA